MKERKRIAVVGNSGSGKSTLASMLARAGGYATLDLDSIVWEPNQIAVARATWRLQMVRKWSSYQTRQSGPDSHLRTLRVSEHLGG